MTDPQIVGNPPNQASLYDILQAITAANVVVAGGAVTNAGLTDLVNVYNQLVNFLAVKVAPFTTATAGSVSAPISSAANSVILGTQACNQVTIQNPVGGVTITYGGDATKADCTMVLPGGSSVTIPVSNVNKIFVISTGAAQTINWLALA